MSELKKCQEDVGLFVLLYVKFHLKYYYNYQNINLVSFNDSQKLGYFNI